MLIGIEASHAAKDNRTGVEEVCYQIIEYLKKELSSNDKVILYSHKDLDQKLGILPSNWELKVLSWRFKKLWSQFRLSKELVIDKPDIFFAPGQLLPWRSQKKTIVYLHDSAFLTVPEAYLFWGKIYLRIMNWWIVKRAFLIITSTEFNRQELKKYYGEKVLAKVKVVPLAYDSSKYNTSIQAFSSEELKNKWQITKPYLLFVGRLETKKNIVNLISAFEKAHKEMDMQLVLVGKPGFGYKEIEKRINKCAYKEDIKILGWTNDNDLSRLFRAAKVFAFLSLYEGFGLPILEAMASGLPVVASSITALEEVGSDAVLYASPHDPNAIAQKLLFILQNPSVYEVMVAKGLKRSQSFTWQSTASRIAKLIEICYSNSTNKA